MPLSPLLADHISNLFVCLLVYLFVYVLLDAASSLYDGDMYMSNVCTYVITIIWGRDFFRLVVNH